MALSAEQTRHTENVFHIAFRQQKKKKKKKGNVKHIWYVFLAPARAPLKLSLALHSVSRVFHLALRQRETHLVCLSCSAESATEAISLALHSVPRVFHLALR